MSQGARGHQAKYVYIAEGAGVVKIGATKDIKARGVGLRRHHGHRFEIVQHWEHRDPRLIEAMVREVLDLHWGPIGFETYSVSREEMACEIEEAIARYDRMQMTEQTATEKWTLRVLRYTDNRLRGRGPAYRAWNYRNKSS